jgi:hypothetical protein
MEYRLSLLVQLLQNRQAGFVHASDLLEAALEEVCQLLVANRVQVALVVAHVVEFVLSFAVLPVFPIL